MNILILLNDATPSGLVMPGKKESQKALNLREVTRGKYDLVIGVGKAVEQVECDWWAFAEKQANKAIGTPKLFCPHNIEASNGSGIRYHAYDNLSREFDVCAAMICAHHLLAKSIRISGYSKLDTRDQLACEALSKALHIWQLTERV